MRTAYNPFHGKRRYDAHAAPWLDSNLVVTFPLPLGYTLGIAQGWGPRAIWFGIIAGLTVAAVLLNSRFYAQATRLRKAVNA
jgi:Na+-driven multidrug efflux pump